MQSIRELREAADMTQFDLAVRLGVTVMTVSNWETRRYEPTARALRDMARLFGVSMDDIDFESPKKAAA